MEIKIINSKEARKYAKETPSGFSVKTDVIVARENYNVRTDLGDIESLAKSISLVGLQQPLSGDFMSDGKFYITDGFRRFAAINYANKHLGANINEVKVIRNSSAMSETDRVVQMFTCGSFQKQLTDYEKAKAIQRISINTGIESPTELSRRIGISVGYLNDLLKFNQLDESVQNLVKENKVSMTALNTVIRAEGDKGIEKIKSNSNNGKITLSKIIDTPQKAFKMIKNEEDAKTLIKLLSDKFNLTKIY